jgi:hypothetical protein
MPIQSKRIVFIKKNDQNFLISLDFLNLISIYFYLLSAIHESVDVYCFIGFNEIFH